MLRTMRLMTMKRRHIGNSWEKRRANGGLRYVDN
jgi:hypothetical protein